MIGLGLVALGGAACAVTPAAEPVTQLDEPIAVAATEGGEVGSGEGVGDEIGDGAVASPAGSEPECGFGLSLEPVVVSVAQVQASSREDTRSALANMVDPVFPDPLIDPAEVATLLVPDGIPAIDEPEFQTAESVDWLACREPVMVVEVGGDARAYPLQIMTWHEIVNDTFGDVAVTVAYCPLCNSGLAYRRDLGSRVLSFGTSGRLYNSSLVMYDRQSESLWTHFEGRAVIGELTGTDLERLPVQIMSLADFVGTRPHGLVLTRNTGHSRDYGRNPYPGYDTTSDDPFAFNGVLDRTLAPKERVISFEAGGETLVVVHDDLVDAGTMELTVGDTRLALWHLPGTASALDASRIAEGGDVGSVAVFAVPPGETFSRTTTGFVAESTGLAYDISGRPVEAGAAEPLPPVEHLNTFWFAIAAFDPTVKIVTG